MASCIIQIHTAPRDAIILYSVSDVNNPASICCSQLIRIFMYTMGWWVAAGLVATISISIQIECGMQLYVSLADWQLRSY